MKSMLILVAVLVTALDASASGLDDPFAGIPARRLDPAEAAAIEGGDVRIRLNAKRNKLEVVETAIVDKTTGHKKAGSQKQYEVDAHNRVVDTTKADFMPKGGAAPKELQDKGKLTSKPERFPSGTWDITEVKERKDKFGPNMINTDAVGEVEVFDKSGKSVGRYKDVGYAIHSNTNDFDSSKSWGCIIVKEEDNRRIASAIKRDRNRSSKNKQRLTVDD